MKTQKKRKKKIKKWKKWKNQKKKKNKNKKGDKKKKKNKEDKQNKESMFPYSGQYLTTSSGKTVTINDTHAVFKDTKRMSTIREDRVTTDTVILKQFESTNEFDDTENEIVGNAAMIDPSGVRSVVSKTQQHT